MEEEAMVTKDNIQTAHLQAEILVTATVVNLKKQDQQEMLLMLQEEILA